MSMGVGRMNKHITPAKRWRYIVPGPAHGVLYQTVGDIPASKSSTRQMVAWSDPQPTAGGFAWLGTFAEFCRDFRAEDQAQPA